MPRELREHTLRITADADAGLLCRISGVLALLCLLPQSFHFRLDAGGEEASIDIVLIGASARQVDLLRRKLAQMTLVSAVD